MRTNFTDLNSIMKKFGYSTFQKKLIDGIIAYLSNTVQMENTDDIVLDYTGADKSITITYVGINDSYYVTCREDSIWVEYRTRRREWEERDRDPDYLWCDFRTGKYCYWKEAPEDKRCPVDDQGIWLMSIFASEDRYEESYINEYEKAPGPREKYVEEARTLMAYAFCNGLNIDDECEWLK